MAYGLLLDPGGPEDTLPRFQDKPQTLRESIRSSLQGLPFVSLTVDNGKEFAAHKETSTDLEARIYFCHPHSPWERPTNENTNGLLRQFFPKYTSFLALTQEHLDWAVYCIINITCSITVHANVSVGKHHFRRCLKVCCTKVDSLPTKIISIKSPF